MYHVLGEVAIFHGQDLLAVEKKKKRSVMQETDGGNFSLPPPRSFKDSIRELERWGVGRAKIFENFGPLWCRLVGH